jgi:hypothetical protein
VSAIVVPANIWAQRLAMKQQLLPHKRRLETLLQELDAL